MNWQDDALPAWSPAAYRIRERPVRNWSERMPTGVAVSALVIHATVDDDVERVLRTFDTAAEQRSSHYLIARDGTMVRLVDERRKAWHAGVSSLWHQPDVNEWSIGVELVAVPPELYTDAQLTTLLAFTVECCGRTPALTLNRIVGHADIATPRGRKTDPAGFPWRDFLPAVGYHLTRLGGAP